MGAKNRVFVFTSGSYSDYCVDYVTACRKQAAAYVKAQGETFTSMESRGDLQIWRDGKEFFRNRDNRWGVREIVMDYEGVYNLKKHIGKPSHKTAHAIRRWLWLVENPRRAELQNAIDQRATVASLDEHINGYRHLQSELMKEPWNIQVHKPTLHIVGSFRSDEVAKLYADEVRCFLIENGTWDKAAAELGDDITKIVRLEVKAL